MSDPNTCRVCGEGFPDQYTKHNSRAPVYGPEPGQAHHKECEEELFEEVYCEVNV